MRLGVGSGGRDLTSPNAPGKADALLEPGTERDQVFEVHPVVTDKAKVPTPAIREAFGLVTGAIVHRDLGVCFVADSRFGKTYAIDALQRTLPQSFPQVPVLVVAAKSHDRPSERSLYTDLLLDCRHGAADIGTASARRVRLLNLWLATAQGSGDDRLTLFIDEAQNWAEDDFTHLRDLTNDLSAHEVRLITVLFGHPSLLSTRASLLAAKRSDLIGRFMLHPRRFSGVASVSDMSQVMACYDTPEVSEFPSGSGISYSEFFRPEAYRAGWRLENEAGSCWAAFSAAAGKHGGHYQVGMQWVAGAIRDFLYVQWQTEHGQLPSKEDAWESAISASGFEFTLGVTQDPMPAV